MNTPDEGVILGPADFGVRTVAEDAAWDETGLTATAEQESPMVGPARRPTWYPETG